MYYGICCICAQQGTFGDGNASLLMFMHKRTVTITVKSGPFAIAVIWTALYFEYGFDIFSKTFCSFFGRFT